MKRNKELRSYVSESIMWLFVLCTFAMPFCYLIIAGYCDSIADWFTCSIIIFVLSFLIGMIIADMVHTIRNMRRA